LIDKVAASGSKSPAQAEQFVAAHAGAGGDPEGGEEPVPGGGTQEAPELVGGPRLLLNLGDRAQPGCMGGEGDVA
jgi:hypothetical protein